MCIVLWLVLQTKHNILLGFYGFSYSKRGFNFKTLSCCNLTFVNYKLALAMDLPPTSTRIKPVLLQLLTFSTPWTELRVDGEQEFRHSVPREQLAGQVFRELGVFRRWFYEPTSYMASYLEKHSNPSWWQLLLMTSKLHETNRNLLEKYVLNCIYYPLTKTTCILTAPPATLQQFQSYLGCCLLRCSPHFVPSKT